MNIKTTITITQAELNEAVLAWLISKKEPLPPSTDLIVQIAGAAVSGGLDLHPVTYDIKDPGSPFSLQCRATCFGYEDPGDDGKGAWGTSTNNTSVVGVAVPIPILVATLGGLTVHQVAGHTVSVICLDTQRSLEKVDIVDEGPGEQVNGQHGLLVDKNGLLTALDMTYGLCSALGVKYDANKGSANVIWWLEDAKGNPVKLLGLDAPKKLI